MGRLLLGDLVAKLVLALAQIRFVPVGIDERVRVAAQQAFVFFHEMEEAPVRCQKNVAGKRFNNAKDLSKSDVIPG